jgi:hypothetical protein
MLSPTGYANLPPLAGFNAPGSEVRGSAEDCRTLPTAVRGPAALRMGIKVGYGMGT